METRTITLTEFLLARIAEDEWVANTASDIRGGNLASHDIVNFGDQRLEIAKARVLAECEAKRQIVEAHRPFTDGGGYTTCSECGATVEDWRVEAERAEAVEESRPVEEWWAFPCRTLRFLALPYADHPDCRDEWKHVVMPQDLGGDEVGAPDLWRGVVDVVAVPVVTSPPVDAEHPPADVDD